MSQENGLKSGLAVAAAFLSSFFIPSLLSKRLQLGDVVLFWFGLVVLKLFYNGYLHPLAKFPGPRMAGMTRWYETFFDLRGSERGQYMYKIREMHERYGPIVRIAPNEVHVNELEFRDVLYTNSQKRDKVPYLTDIFGTPLAIFGTIPHELHRKRRSTLNPFFSKASILRIETTIMQKVDQMCSRISEQHQNQQTMYLRHYLTACIVDITTEFSFGKCANALDGPECSPEWEAMMVGVSEAVPLARAFPGIVQIAQSLPIGVVRLINPLMASYAEFEQIMRQDVKEIFEMYEKGNSSETMTNRHGVPTIFHEILGSTLPESEKTVDRMTQDALSFVSAASETTTTVIATIVFFVAADTKLQTRLRSELSKVMPSKTSTARWTDLEKLPFLSALIKEGLRLSVPVCSRLPLTVRSTTQFHDWIIPEGTYVGMSPADALHHPEIFPNPRQFDPDRWLLPSDQQRSNKMQMAFVPFNRGPRMCIGMHLAYANMYIIIGMIFRRFELQTVDTVRERDVDFVRDYFVAKPSRNSQGIRIRVTREID